MTGRSYPNGHTSGAMLKALQKHLELANGRSAVDTWLAATRTERRDLEDESRAVPLPRFLGALRAFVDIAGAGAIDRAAVHLIAPDNLGAWTRILRGSTEPIEALDRLDATDTELSRSVRWETLSRSRTAWTGRVHLAHDPSLESDGLLRAARMAELSMIPALFGLGRGQVSSIEAVTTKGQVQDFELRWQVPAMSTLALGGAAFGALAGACSFASEPWSLAVVWVGVGAGFGVLMGLLASHDRARRVESVAQRTRVYALERSLLLRDAAQAAQSGTLEGTVVAGQYRVVRRMGSGGSGVIYEALRASDGLPVAIKLLRAVAAHDSVASDRLRREAEALGLAWHPNVVDVLDHGHLPDGTSFLVMELLRGESLAVHLEAKLRLTPEELLPMALQVADALVAVHAAGVVHRDLKPSNIFITPPVPPSTAPPRVKLIDFGIARVEWEETRITNIGAPVGTPGYMSPEQEAGGDVDGRCDVFAFGQVMAECLLGRPPAPTNGRGRSDPPADAKPGPAALERRELAERLLSPAWRAFVEKATAVEPEDRFPDARTMGAALRALAEDSERPSGGGPRSGDAPDPAKAAGVS